MVQPARQQRIRRIQDIFRENERRLFHSEDSRAIPAENNLAERDLRPSVFSRKVRLGSITDAGTEVRSMLTFVAETINKRGEEVKNRVKLTLDLLVCNPQAHPYAALLPSPNPT